MNKFRLIIQTLRHYPFSSMATAAGIAIATAIICGALIIGDSLRKSLEQVVNYRLGNITHTITAGERLFTRHLAYRMNESGRISAAPVLKSEAMVSVQEKNVRLNKVQVWGIDKSFENVVGSTGNVFSVDEGDVVIGDNLASRLGVESGDFVLLHIRAVKPIPPNTPFVSETGQTISRRVKVGKIITKEEFAHFNLNVSQSAPYNIFANLDWLNRIMELGNNANMIMIHGHSLADTDEIRSKIVDNTQLQDMNLMLEQVGETRDWKLSSGRVFMDNYISETISTTFQDAKPYLSYFVNGIRHGSMETPYSFVTALDNPQYITNPDDMVINRWLSDDLQVNVGDSLTLRYFVVGPLRELEEHQAAFRITGILPMEEAGKDNMLMPHIPGLSDAGSCRDWDTGVPIDLDKIRQKDQDYWDDYRGAPKAYISLHRGQELWQNRFGNLTMVVFPGEVFDEQEIQDRLARHLDPFRLEYQINTVREHGMEAARGGVDFSQLFAGLGIFIIVSGLLLTVLLLQYSLQRRQKQIQLFSALGFTKALVRKLVMTEAFLIIIAGALLGMIVSIGYSRLVFSGLNRIWHDIVRTDVLEMHISGTSLLSGFLASVVLGSLVVYFGIGKTVTADKRERMGKRKIRTIVFYIAMAFTIIFGFFSLYALAYDSGGLFAWLLAGISLLISLLFWTYHLLQAFQQPTQGMVSTNLLSWKNLVRNPTRSFTIVTLLALGSFVIIVTAANRKDLMIDAMDRSGGTGGYRYIAETTVPVLRNLNHPESKAELVLPDHVNFVQFLSTHDDDASCFNLNRVANPRLLATDPAHLAERFSFVSRHPLLDRDHPWLSLDMEFEGVVPAVADQSVMQWGLGKKVGDTLFYVNARGEEIGLLLIGGLRNSVLQGNVVISQKNFLKHFPATGGSNVFLLDYNGEDAEALQNELNFIFRDHGWEMTSTADKLAGFNTVENTYLRIFFLLGAFGMLLGTVGLAIVLAKSMLERRNETAMFKALGFRARTILRLYFTEYAALFLLGLFAGAIPALVANTSSWLAGTQNVSNMFLVVTMGAILFNGLVWILAIPALSIMRIKVLKDLRD